MLMQFLRELKWWLDSINCWQILEILISLAIAILAIKLVDLLFTYLGGF